MTEKGSRKVKIRSMKNKGLGQERVDLFGREHGRGESYVIALPVDSGGTATRPLTKLIIY